MHKKTKNIVSIILIVLMIASLVLTVNLAQTNNKNSMPEMGGERPEMPNSGSGDNQPPEMSNDNQPPEMPDSGNGSNPPEKPDGDNTEANNKPSESSNEKQQMSNQSTSLDITYYVLFGIESLILSATIMYLIMSNFNSKTALETFASNDKKTIYGLSIIILTIILTYGSSLLAINSKSSNSNNSNNSNNPNNQTNTNYTANTEIKEETTITSGNYTSSSADENAILVTADANISNITVSKTGDSDGGDNTSFYGTNSAVLAKDKATLTLENVTIETSATGANGVFSYGGSATTNNSSSDGTKVVIKNSKITTTKDNSGGIMTTGGGIMEATNLEIETAGTSSAAIRSDRGGGTVTVNEGTYKTTGKGSPTIYSTADITVTNANLIATASEGVVIEGKNKVTLNSCNLEDTNTTLNGKSTTYKNIFLYQSMSGDAATGNSEFTAKDSTITTNKGDTFYVTNTSSTITLENNTIINNDASGNFLRIQSDSWGNSNSNGGDVILNAANQEIKGNIVVDKISTLSISLKNNSTFEGIINGSNTAKSLELTLDKTSKIKLLGDTYLTSFNNEDSSNSNVDFNGYKLYVNGKTIN